MNNDTLTFKADRNAVLKDFLINECHVSKRLLTKLKQTENGITVNGIHTRVIDRINAGDTVKLKISDSGFLEGNPELKVPKAFENESFVVYDKPVGMPVHPSIKHQGDTLGNCFAADYPSLKFRPVNRLDRDTSGLCVVAKSAYAAALLQNGIEKTYFAVVQGNLTGEGVIDLPIARECDSIIKRVVREDGQRAVTHYKAIRGNGRFTLLEIKLETGRTHQIRVHFSHIGYPLAGDDLYGGDTLYINNQALHCGEMLIDFPGSEEKIRVCSGLREDMKKLLEMEN